MLASAPMDPRPATSPLAVIAVALALTACSFDSPFAGKRATERHEALPPPSDLGEDTAPAPVAPAPTAAPTPPWPEARLHAESAGPSLEWHTALEGNAVAVELIDASSHYRVERVTLLGPGGAAIAAAALNREVERSYGYGPGDQPPGNVGVGVFGGSASRVGVSIGTAVHGGGPSYTGVPKTRTRARIVLADPAAYRSDATAWKIAVELIDSAGETSLVEIPAPPL